MATRFYSDQLVNGIGTNVYAPIDASALAGRIRVSRFSWTCPTTPPVQNDITVLCQIPLGAIVLNGKIFPQSGFTATGAQIGFDDGVTADAYALTGSGGVDLSAGSIKTFADDYTTYGIVMPTAIPAPNTPYTSSTSTGQPGSALLESVAVAVTWASATLPAAGKTITGYVMWTLD